MTPTFPRAQVVAALAVSLLGTGATGLAAQCPDGSPPPCGRRTVAAASRPVTPPLDDRTWIVVPFDNLAKAADADWLRSASVNLLYLDMSRWKDIRVIDDERVADLVRETPEAASAPQLSLNAGLAVAKRAGAGKLVMGDVLRLGTRTTVTAKVFDVKSGQRVRSVKEDALVQDSVMPLFGKLAQRILDVAPPPGANIGAIGTTRIDAYQEYLAGVAALNRFELGEAKRRLAKALALDSTFALAHYKMSVVVGWDDPSDPAQRRHAASAARYQAALPPRVRSLITGLAHQASNEWTRACEVYSSVVKADSSDVEGWYGVGECLYHDPTVAPIEGDTSRMQFRANWQQSIRAFQRVLELDPQYHLAYQHIIDAHMTPRHNGAYCAPLSASCTNFTSYVIRTGDTLVMQPVPVTDAEAIRRQLGVYDEGRSKRRNLAAAEDVAREWVRVAPSQSRSATALAFVLAAQGNVREAQIYLQASTSMGSLVEELRRLLLRMEISHKVGAAREALRLYDSARAANGPIPGNPALRFGNAVSGYGPPFGRLVEFDSSMAVNMRQANAPPLALQYQRLALRGSIGAPPNDSLVAVERDLFVLTKTNRGSVAATRSIASSLSYSMRVPRATWPALDSTVRDLKLRPALALARGDSAALRTAARVLDSAVARIVATAGSDTGYTLVAAEAYLALNDTTAALKSLRFGLDTAMATAAYFPMQGWAFTPAYFVPRLMLLRADLAAARGLKPEARVWYQRFIDAWSGAVPELQPVVERARQALAALGPAG